MKSITRKQVRTINYVITLITLIAVSTILFFLYVSKTKERSEKNYSLFEESIINQKKNYLQSVILQSIGEINSLVELKIESGIFTASIISENLSKYIGLNEDRSANLVEELESLLFYQNRFQYIIYDDEGILSSSREKDLTHLDEINSSMVKSVTEYEKIKIVIYIPNEEFSRELKTAAETSIRNIRLPNDEYIWINYILNYQGGDDYAIRLVHPNLPDTEGMLLSTSMEDIKGNRPYLEELNGINEKGEVFFQYYFKKMDSDVISHKLTYAKLYERFDWVIATGVYLDDIAQIVTVEKDKIRKELSKETLFLAAVIFLILALAISVFINFEKRIGNLIFMKNQELSRANTVLSDTMERLQETNRELQESLSQVQTLSGLLPICAKCKKIRDEKGYWKQIESYIESHSQAQFSHGLCKDCEKEIYGDEEWYKKNK